MRSLTLILVLLVAASTTWAQECKRKRDEFDQEDMILCQESADVRYIGESSTVTGVVARAGWHETPDTPYLLLVQPAMRDVGDALNMETLQDRTADLIVDGWTGETRAETDYQDISVRIAVGMKESLAMRVARADTFKVRVGGWPFDVSTITWQVARLLEMTTDASFGEKAEPKGEREGEADDPDSGVEEEPPAPYSIEGLGRDPDRAPLPRYTEKVNARIQVKITVNPEGRIVRRIPLEEANPELLSAVMSALQRWRFNDLPPGAPQENQTGTITFHFRTKAESQEQTDLKTLEPPPEEEEDQEIFMVVENQPELIGGMRALQDSVEYPEPLMGTGIEGRVIVSFIVDEQGNVQDPKVTRGGHDLLEKAAIEAVRKQKFEPGKQRGEAVKVEMSLPVTFRLP